MTETVDDIVNEVIEDYPGVDCFDAHVREIGERTKRAYDRENKEIERLIRDAIVSYRMSYDGAPNEECKRELRERAEKGNRWLARHGFAEESFEFSDRSHGQGDLCHED